MYSLILAALLTPIQYNFPAQKPVVYEMKVSMQGYIPVLGGNEGTAELFLGIEVGALPPDSEGRLRAYNDLVEVKTVFNGATLPFGLDSIKSFFPKTTVSHSPHGKVLANDAPDVQLPVRLPGLDPKRFPEITYLPLEFPAEGVEIGKSWTFVRKIGPDDMVYTVKTHSLDDASAKFGVSVQQTSLTFEDEAGELVAEAEGIRKVETTLTGQGEVHFDRKKGMATQVRVVTQAQGNVTDLSSKKVSQRQLTTTLDVRLRGTGPSIEPSPKKSSEAAGWQSWLQRTADFATNVSRSVSMGWSLLKAFLGIRVS
ncbi:MAG: hypothetical protein M5U21_05030 [Fimbriimonadaceae bacterium]|nr:hypothetical protein [Fimbriimonadaceae bacterium]